MPPINQATLSAGVIAVSVAVAAAIAIYESPELQRMATDLRRRIALALHSLGDGISGPNHNSSGEEPLFNRPEDAEGFLETGDIDADDESRRRQREELLYWNAVKLSKELERQTDENEKAKENEKAGRRQSSVGSTFDDFLREDESADEKGTYVFNTGAEMHAGDEGLVRRRGQAEGVRGLNASLYANPFADEHGIDYDEHLDASAGLAPGPDEVTSLDEDDIYNATPAKTTSRTVPETMPELMSVEHMPKLVPGIPVPGAPQHADIVTDASGEEDEDEYMTAGQTDQTGSEAETEGAYASIQAWAEQQQQAQQQNRESSLNFYSPLPVTPAASLSEAMSDGELVSVHGNGSSSESGEVDGDGDGQVTPTDSGSVAGSGVEVALSEVGGAMSPMSRREDGKGKDEGCTWPSSPGPKSWDVLSESEDGASTPARSWTEVGSVVSESEDGRAGAARS